MSGITLTKENGKFLACCSECGEPIDKTTNEINKLMETGKLKKVSGVCSKCEAKFRFSLQFSGVEHAGA
jgi:RNase P subunit RPR2